MLRELDVNNFDDEVSNGLKTIEFYTTWCSYCKKQQTELEHMDKIWIGQIDADNNTELATKFKVNAFPTFIILNDGKEIGRISGFNKKEDLMEKLLIYIKK